MSQQLLDVLSATLAPDANAHTRALEFLSQAAAQNFVGFVQELSAVLRAEQAPPEVRQQAGLQLKNVLYAKEDATRETYLQRWLTLPDAVRTDVKRNVVQSLGTEQRRPSIAAQCVAAIACAELPTGHWADVIQLLMTNVTNPASSEALMESSLETLGYICQDIDPKVLQSQANAILTAIIHGMRKEERSDHVRLAATTALSNALEFTNNNFNNENERNIIMRVVCEATQSPDIKIKVAALQCLVRIMSLYYQLMEPYMRALFPITVQAMKSSEDNECLQGIEFWSNVCDEEITLAVLAEEAAENNTVPERTSKHYAKGASPHLCPLLLETLAKQDEGDDEDDWSPCKAAGVCIMLLAQCVGNDIVPSVQPFLSNFGNNDWRYKDAAIMAFGSILDGPDPALLQPLVVQALPPLITALNDNMVVVRDSTAWTIGRILEICPEVVADHGLLQALLPAFSNGLHQEPRVAANICWALIALARAAYDQACSNGTDATGQPETFSLSVCFEQMVAELIKVTDRADGNQSNLRLAAYETLMELIKNSPKDCYHVVQQTTLVMLERLEGLLRMESSTSSSIDKSALVDLQTLLCATLQSVLRKVREEDAPKIAPHIMSGLLHIMSRSSPRNGSVMEEALMAVSALAEILRNGFSQYADAVRPHIVQGLTAYEESGVCIAAAGLVVDICRNQCENFINGLDEIMERIVVCLQEPKLSRDAKVSILGMFGDIALAIGGRFERYSPIVMNFLSQASADAVISDPNDLDEVDYVDKLRENIVNSYVGILQSMIPEGADGNIQVKQQARQKIFPLVDGMHQLIMKCCEQRPDASDSLICGVAGLVGDLLNLFGADILGLLNNEKINGLLNKGRRSKTSKTKSVSAWASKEMRKISQNATH